LICSPAAAVKLRWRFMARILLMQLDMLERY